MVSHSVERCVGLDGSSEQVLHALSLQAAQEVVGLLFPDGIPAAEVGHVSSFQQDVAEIIEYALWQQQLATGAAHGKAEEQIN